MLRYLAGAMSALLLVAAGMFLFGSRASTEQSAMPVLATGTGQDPPNGAEDAALPEASPQTREQKRFNRYDRDRDGNVAREEYLASRRKAYARLDANGDGRLTFEEWAAKTTEKFTGADHDRSGTLTPAEFATTAVKRSPQARLRCPPQQAPNESD